MELICIICPNSCVMTIEDGIVTGAKCKRGDVFAIQEEKEPLRTVTTTMFCVVANKTELIPVKSKESIPLKGAVGIIKKAKRIKLTEKPKLGDIIMDKDLLGNLQFQVTGE